MRAFNDTQTLEDMRGPLTAMFNQLNTVQSLLSKSAKSANKARNKLSRRLL